MIVLKRGDTRTAIRATLVDAQGDPVDLTGSVVRWIMATLKRTPVVARQAEVVDAKHGVVLVPLEPGDTDTAGTYWAEFEVTFGDGRVETYPNRGYLTVNSEPDLR